MVAALEKMSEKDASNSRLYYFHIQENKTAGLFGVNNVNANKHEVYCTLNSLFKQCLLVCFFLRVCYLRKGV